MTPYSPPPMTPRGDGWEAYVDAPIHDATNVAELAPGTLSPEAAVIHFYASRIRGDERYLEVMPPPEQRHPVVARKLAKMAAWSFEQVKLVARSERGRDKFYIKIALTIRFRDKTKAFTDDVTVQQSAEQWLVVRPPT